MEDNYYNTKDSVEEYIKLSQGINGSELIDELKVFLPKGSTLLELGTGPGSDWNILKNDYKVTGSDNSTEFLNHLITKNPEGNFIELDAVTLKLNTKFDGIYSNKVMHHLNDNELAESIKKQNEILNSNGIICHSFWKGEGSEIFKGLFVNYHTKEALKNYFEKYFEILLLETYNEFKDDDSILLIGRKK
jgi:cyclopropane fatty-acyl-phospholipid synthase-like methyltransferase